MQNNDLSKLSPLMPFGDVICITKVWKIDFSLKTAPLMEEIKTFFFSRQKASNTPARTSNNPFITDKSMAKFCVIKHSDVATQVLGSN